MVWGWILLDIVVVPRSPKVVALTFPAFRLAFIWCTDEAYTVSDRSCPLVLLH